MLPCTTAAKGFEKLIKDSTNFLKKNEFKLRLGLMVLTFDKKLF